MMFICSIVFLAAASEALYYVKILSTSLGMGSDFYEIITFDNPSVSRKEVWDKVNKSEYVVFRRTNKYDNKEMSLQVIAPGKCEKFDDKTATADMVHIEGAEIVLEFLAKEHVATILDIESTMLLGHFMHYAKTATVKSIWYDAGIHSSVFSKSMWNDVTEIRVEAPGHPTKTITKQTPENTEVQVENAKFFVKIKAEQGVRHMVPIWKTELNKEGMLAFKSYKYTGLFRFLDTHMTVQDIWNAVNHEVAPPNVQGYTVTMEELRIVMAKGTKNVEVKLADEKDNTNKIGVATITDVIYGVRTVTGKIAPIGFGNPPINLPDLGKVWKKVEKHKNGKLD